MKPATRNLLILGVCIVALGGVLAALMLTGGTTEASHHGLFVAGHCTFKSGRSGGCLDW